MPTRKCCKKVVPSNCDLRCYFKCIGIPAELPGNRCPIPCGIRISIPTPSTIPYLNDMDCPPVGAGCSSHPCNSCYTWDTAFYFSLAGFDSQWMPPGWEFNAGESILDVCDNALWVFNRYATSCWTRLNADCPEDPPESWPLFCGPEIQFESKLKINATWDGNCGEVIVELIVTAIRNQCTVEIDIDTMDPMPFPATTHTYKFSRSWCNCEDLLGVLSYVSTTSVNNERGITVPDPCNLAGSVVTLFGDLESPCTNNCPCWECEEGSEGIYTVNISGPVFTGSFPVGANQASPCSSVGEFEIDCGDPLAVTNRATAILSIICLDCEYYIMRLTLNLPAFDSSDTWVSDPFQCGESVVFNEPEGYTGCLDGHTITLS